MTQSLIQKLRDATSGSVDIETLLEFAEKELSNSALRMWKLPGGLYGWDVFGRGDKVWDRSARHKSPSEALRLALLSALEGES